MGHSFSYSWYDVSNGRNYSNYVITIQIIESALVRHFKISFNISAENEDNNSWHKETDVLAII